MPTCRAVVASLAAVLMAAFAAGCGNDRETTAGSTRGELIAYSASDGIHLVAPDGSGDEVVPGTESLSGPRWAADGRRLAAVDLLSCCRAYAVSLDGEVERLPANSDTTPDWSPDGDRIVAVEGEVPRIRVVRVADGAREALIAKFGNQPDWSPDGRLIAFQSRGADDLLHIYLVRPTGEGLRPLTTPSGGDVGEDSAAWSPDSRWVTFTGDADGDDDIYVIRADGKGLRQVTDTPSDEASPSWSPDGKRLVFGRGWPDNPIIVVRDLESGKETVIAAGETVGEPAWQPRPSA